MTLPTDPPVVRGIPPRPIHERQLDEDMLLLQRAAAASHQRGQIWEAVRVGAAVAIAAAGVVITLIGHGRTAVTIVGFLWFVVSTFLVKRLAANTARQGALLQEMFDTKLFCMPWRATVAGNPIHEPDVYRLARQLRRGGKKDKRITDGWYDPTHDVHHPYDVFIAQEQNLAWDSRLRRRYSQVIAAVAIAWAGIGLIASLAANATLLVTLLSFFAPSLAAYQIASEIWSSHRKVADERERLAKEVNTELSNGRPGPISNSEQQRLLNAARDIQDGILRTRLESARVPEWFYKCFRDNDERDFGDTSEGRRVRLAQEAPSAT